MPVVTIRALPQRGLDRTTAAKNIGAAIATAAGVQPTDIWIVWSDVESGAYRITTTDLSVHARGLNFVFNRSYNSLDDWYEPDGSSYFTSLDVTSTVIMKPLVPLYSNWLSPRR